VAQAISGIFDNPKDIFLKTRVMDFLFDGILINCTGTSFPVKSVCMQIKKAGAFPEVEPNVYKFSIFGRVSMFFMKFLGTTKDSGI